MPSIANRMDDIPFSAIRTMLERVTVLERQGNEVIHLESGKPDFDTPAHIKQACIGALEQGHTQYSSNYGCIELRQAIADKLKYDNDLDYCPRQEILVTTGVSQGIFLAMMSALNPQDEVLLLSPVFPPYVMAARMAGAIPVIVQTEAEHHFQPQVSDLKSKVTDKTKMLVITSPANPTGTVLSAQTLQQLADFAIEQNLLVLSDEIYEKLIFDGLGHFSIAQCRQMKARTIVLNGFSKAYAMTGWRIGYVAAGAKWIDAMVRLQQNTVVCATAFAQMGAVAALRGPEQPVRDMVKQLDQHRLLLVEGLKKNQSMQFTRPQGAMYLYANVNLCIHDAYEIATMLLERYHLALVPWDREHIRISYGCNTQQLTKAIEILDHFGRKFAR